MAQYLPQKPTAVPLIAALTANSYFLSGNIEAVTSGVLPYVLEQSSSSEAVRGTNWFIGKGKIGLFPSAVLSGVFFGATALYAPDARARQLTTVAAVSVLTIFSYTAVFMLPTNEALAKMEKGGTQALEGKEEKALEKVMTWRAQHMVRVALGAVGWVAGVLALEKL